MAQLMQSAPTDYQLEAEQLARRRKLVEALQQQGMGDMPQGAMVSGRYVKPAFTQQLAHALKAPLAEYQGRKLDEEQKRLGIESRQQKAKDFADALQAGTGTPAKPEIQMPSDDVGGGPGRDASPAVAGSRREMFAKLLQSQFPELQQIGMTGITKEDEAFTLKPGETRFRGATQVAALPPKQEFGTTPHYEKGPDGKTYAVYSDKDGNRKLVEANPMNQFTTGTVDSNNRLAQAQQHFNSLSAEQKAALTLRAQQTGVSIADLMFNTGMAPAPVNVPGLGQPSPAPTPQAQPMGAPTPQASPQIAPQAPQAGFPRITPEVQAGRNAEQIALLQVELQQPVNSNPADQARIRAEIAKLSTGNPFAAPGGDPLRPATAPVAPMTGKTQQAALLNAANQRTELEQKRQFNMGGISETIAEARRIMKTGVPTASKIGQAADFVGSVFGAAPKGAAEADQLRAIGGALTSKVPRMEGPQSNLDVELYKQMAGDVGNAGLPLSRRLAALDTVEKLYAKYEHLNRPETPQPAPASDRRAAESGSRNRRIVVDY